MAERLQEANNTINYLQVESEELNRKIIEPDLLATLQAIISTLRDDIKTLEVYYTALLVFNSIKTLSDYNATMTLSDPRERTDGYAVTPILFSYHMLS